MRAIHTLFPILGILLLALSCGKNDPPPPQPPSAALLVFPFQNSECNTGNQISNDISEVTFEWQASDNTDSYVLSVTNLGTNNTQTITTTNTMATSGIARAAPFSWSVTSSNMETTVRPESETWLFFNAGSITNYPPFPAQLVSPKSGAAVLKNTNDEILFQWSGADVEDDIVSYELFLSEPDAEELTSAYTGTDANFTVAGLVSQSVYKWRVGTTDAQEHTSSSNTYEFSVR